MIKTVIREIKESLTLTILFVFRRAVGRNLILSDLKRWQQILVVDPDEPSSGRILIRIFRGWPEFRNLFYYRLKNDPITGHFLF